ncbi:uncharacterized protein LOC106661233 [Cimex lectularius]|uniref:CPR type cuticle protein n=1 Tax=Cimex lectularius TaxID=79782 RepID=A0A8I6R747_CIMLE|nr:uncharacterized protein LOC106661233 [Cimex lectularius]
MKLLALVLIAIILSEAHSAPPVGEIDNKLGNAGSRIVYYHNENRGADGYDFSYETDDGTKRREKGEFVNGVWTVTGVFEWRSPDGMTHKMMFKADDTGYSKMLLITKSSFSAGALASLTG